MGRKSKFIMTEIIDFNEPKEKPTERLIKLKGLLAEELKYDKPSMRYIEDLKESIKQCK